MKPHRKLIIACLVTLAVLVLILPAVEVCRDWAYVDRHTGSRKGHREWLFGFRTGSWYTDTALERFMRTNHPVAFEQSWVSYAGTGRNAYGGGMSSRHGNPGPIIHLDPRLIDAYCEQASDAERIRLYEVFASDDGERIRETVNQIIANYVKEASSSDE